MLTRRNVLAGSAASLLLARSAFSALPVPADGKLAYKVMRNGSEIGSHVFTFTQAGDELTVKIEVGLAVRFGPITLFRYAHHAAEVWKGEAINSLETDSDDNGTPYAVRAHREADGLHCQGTRAQPYIAPPDALPSTHWNRKVLDGPWINSQDGRLVHPQIDKLGRAQVTTAEGAVSAEGYRITASEVLMDSWYDDASTWCGVSFKGSDGSQITYLRL